MRTTRQLVQCRSCGWSGDRSTLTDPREKPCPRDGGAVFAIGEPFEEVRSLAACHSCGWWGLRQPEYLAGNCPRCHGPECGPAFLYDATGYLFTKVKNHAARVG